MKIPIIQTLSNTRLLQKALSLPNNGKLAVSVNKLVYLDIDDGYIHDLFPLLKGEGIVKPNYFGKNGVGAHISVIYPEEALITKFTPSSEHSFNIKDLIAAEIGSKIYYALAIQANTLLQVRRSHGLTDLLNFKAHVIGFHITIGVREGN